MELSEIKSKLQQERDILEELELKKKKLEEKINTKKKKIEEYERLIQSKLYTDIDSQLDNLGMTL